MFLLQDSQRRDSVMTGKDKEVQSSVEQVHFNQDEPLGWEGARGCTQSYLHA